MRARRRRSEGDGDGVEGADDDGRTMASVTDSYN